MEMLYLILAEAGIELVPRKLWLHPSVRSSAAARGKKPGEILLDVSLHHHAMLRLKDREKRGRPDITHFCLLLALSSLLNKCGFLRVRVYTYEGKWISVASETRLPRNYNRFVGLMEQLLIKGHVPPGADKPLLKVLHAGFKEGIRDLKVTRVFLLDETGTPKSPRELARLIVREERPAVVVGAFQKGSFSEEVTDSADDIISIAPIPLDAWTIVARVISSVEDALGIYEGSIREGNKLRR